jgi:hypothetical protein
MTKNADAIPDPHDVELAELLLELTPMERLRALKRYARLHELAREQLVNELAQQSRSSSAQRKHSV